MTRRHDRSSLVIPAKAGIQNRHETAAVLTRAASPEPMADMDHGLRSRGTGTTVEGMDALLAP